MKANSLHGVVPPVCTPLTDELEVDTPSLRRHIDFLVESGVDGLFVLGSTSEVAFLTDAMRTHVIETAVDQVAGRVPVLTGAIDMTTLRVLEHARVAERAGCDGLVVTAPFYTRTHPAEIEQHFRLIAGDSHLPVYAYDLPVSVHTKLDSDMLVRLAAEGVLAGVKDSSGDDAGLRKLVIAARQHAPESFSVLTGSELTVDTSLRMGVDGVVPGLGNVDPHGYVRLYQYCRDGKWDEALTEQERLLTLFGLVDAGDSSRMGPGSSALGAFKAGMQLRGIIDSRQTAPPQFPLNDTELTRVRSRLETAGLL